MFRHLLSILSLLCMIVSPAVADLASVSHVNTMRDNVQAKIDKKADNANYTPNMVLQLDALGNVVATTVGPYLLAEGAIETMHLADGAVTNADLAGMIDITKLNLGTLPTSGRHIMIWNAETQKYVFEAYAFSGLLCPVGQYDIGFSQCIDPATDGTSDGYDDKAMTWYVDFKYGRVSGIASCTSDGSSWQEKGTAYPDRNFDQSVTGPYCYCKMTHPVASAWVYRADFGLTSDCSKGCALNCGGDLLVSENFRGGFFGAVGK